MEKKKEKKKKAENDKKLLNETKTRLEKKFGKNISVSVNSEGVNVTVNTANKITWGNLITQTQGNFQMFINANKDYFNTQDPTFIANCTHDLDALKNYAYIEKGTTLIIPINMLKK